MPAPWSAILTGALLLHACVRRPRASRPLLVYLPPGVWALPAAGRFDLRLTAATAVGPGWARLDFGPGGSILLLADQFEPGAWRRLRAAVGESLCLVPRGRSPHMNS